MKKKMIEGIKIKECTHDLASPPSKARHPDDRGGEKGDAHHGPHDF